MLHRLRCDFLDPRTSTERRAVFRLRASTGPQISPSPLLVSAIGSFSNKSIGAALTFLSGVMIARLLGPYQYGLYALILSLVTILATISALGLPSLITREIAAHAEHNRPAHIRGIILRSNQWTFLFASVLTALAAYTAWNVAEPDSRLPIMLGTSLILLGSLNQIRAAILRGLNRVVLADMPDFIVRPFFVVILVTLNALIFQELQLVSAIGIQIASAVFAFLSGSYLLLRRQQPIDPLRPVFPDREWLYSTLPFLAVAVIALLEQNLPLLVLGSLADPREAGLYQAPLQLVALMSFGLFAVNMALQPRLAAAWSARDIPQAQHLATTAARIGFGLAIVIGSIFALFAETLLSLFGDAFLQASNTLRLLIVGQLANAAAGSCATVLAMTGHQRVLLRGTCLGLAVNAIFALVLIPHFGSTGAAIAAATGLITWNSYLAVKAFNLTRIRTVIYL